MSESTQDQLAAVKRIKPERIQMLVKVTIEQMMTMDPKAIQQFSEQCEADYNRLMAAASQLMAAARLLIEQQGEANDVMIERKIRIR